MHTAARVRGRVCSGTKSCSAVSDPMDCNPRGSLSMGFSRQEDRSGLPFPSPGALPQPGIEPRSPALAGQFLTAEPPRTTHVKDHSL